MSAMNIEPENRVGKLGTFQGKLDAPSDEKTIDRAVQGVLRVFQNLDAYKWHGQKYNYGRIPLKELIDQVLKNDGVERERVGSFVDPVFKKLKTLSDPVLTQQIAKEEEAELVAIAKHVHAQSEKDPNLNLDTAILDSLADQDPAMSEQQVDQYMSRVLDIISDYRETGTWPEST
ncbi:hypothetical protein A3C21_00235 [Candidatus Kaiserbacteria bacterium RIFCSPHIGHO2_02_FULL_59_21]|uniref:Uncharacterized protein n=2 Tax=Candidatus Kaiseribacteriota TaxID=1752734 RepID=A0A1F6E1F6_9BACT|nr:MAG: hypothetical protein A2766_01070 [Candidatus Kaiserbacteria bacterium RIFCSPHIGHO2_01_FULL_58_22]OGG67514.1 MAG: hypothetical protein A3C21_00235 [Candidatus Kaiserbacteria bacterium RIFCSPHIGHO2_02_FULL_59_21]OGG86467.1 MAG: hypothetical protein A3I47_03885 [Candidatus Kaiserbacteria bacterium RIFCSPLOWO2_02_FULL_59_19]